MGCYIKSDRLFIDKEKDVTMAYDWNFFPQYRLNGAIVQAFLIYIFGNLDFSLHVRFSFLFFSFLFMTETRLSDP
jgi:hypothetical protein